MAAANSVAGRPRRKPFVVAAATTRVMSSLLFGVGATDPVTYAIVAIGLGGTALLASYIPARRASRIDPAIALRWEA